MVPIKHKAPSPDTDRLAEVAALSDTSPFAQAFWLELGEVRRRDVLTAWAMTGGAK